MLTPPDDLVPWESGPAAGFFTGWLNLIGLIAVTASVAYGCATFIDLTPEERKVEIQEWKDGVASGDILEVFACGTAAIVTPIGGLKWAEGEAPSTAGEFGGEVTRGIRERLLSLQQGRTEDSYGWMHRLV